MSYKNTLKNLSVQSETLIRPTLLRMSAVGSSVHWAYTAVVASVMSVYTLDCLHCGRSSVEPVQKYTVSTLWYQCCYTVEAVYCSFTRGSAVTLTQQCSSLVDQCVVMKLFIDPYPRTSIFS